MPKVSLPWKFDWIIGASPSLSSKPGVLVAKNVSVAGLDWSTDDSWHEFAPITVQAMPMVQSMNMHLAFGPFKVYSGESYAQALTSIPDDFWLLGD